MSAGRGSFALSLVPTHLQPAVPAVDVAEARLQLAAGFVHEVSYLLDEEVVILHAEERRWQREGDERLLEGGYPPQTAAFSLPVTSPVCPSDLQADHGEAAALGLYLQTKTLTGARVLGVMIHGATLNTTASVKIGEGGMPWGRQAEIGTFHTSFTTIPPEDPPSP